MRSRQNIGAIALSTSAFAMLGFASGLIMGQSRDPAVDTVLPAIFTLLGGVLAYLIGSKGVRSQVGTSAMMICFAFALLVGAQYGAALRGQFELDPSIEAARHRVALQGLLGHATILAHIQDLAKEKQIDPALLYAVTFGVAPKVDATPSKP